MTAEPVCEDLSRLTLSLLEMTTHAPIVQLFREHNVPLYRFFLSACGRVDLAEDLTQEVFARAIAAQERYREQGEGRAWLFRIARNLLADWRRRRARRPQAVGIDSIVEVPLPESSPELRTQLGRALGALPRDDREVFLLSQVAGLSYREIAAATDSSEAAVRSRIFRARMALRACLGPTEAETSQTGPEGDST